MSEEPDMKLYSGIDLHSNNNVIHLIDGNDKPVFKKRVNFVRSLEKASACIDRLKTKATVLLIFQSRLSSR